MSQTADVKVEEKPEVEQEGGEEEKDEPRTPKTVLLVVDGTPPSNQAVKWYLEDLHQDGNTCIFVHAWRLQLNNTLQELMETPDTLKTAVEEKVNTNTRLEKNLMRRLKRRQIEGKFTSCSGSDPEDAILSVAKAEDVDMIIMGSRAPAQGILGSAHCPILVHKRKVKAKEGKE